MRREIPYTEPKGKLIIIGGSEHKGIPNEKEEINPDFMPQEILKRIITEKYSEEASIVIIPTASRIPDEIGEDYIKAFAKIGCNNIEILKVETRDDAYEQKNVDKITNSGAVLISGGDQMRLSTILGGSPVLEEIRYKYLNENFIIAGTSAGAMVMSNSMIFSGASEEAFFKGELKITSGFGLLPAVIIDTHFIKRGRFGRLAQAVAINPSYIGLGLEEDTAVFISKGIQMEAIGSGNVIIIDGHDIRSSNLTEIEEGAPISIERLVVHVLARGDMFSLSNRKFLSSETKEAQRIKENRDEKSEKDKKVMRKEHKKISKQKEEEEK